ncbi:MAG: signal peptidase I [Dehalococcoidia bacterium]|nr:signal peptidase I [Dehalococcoidia bacterium]
MERTIGSGGAGGRLLVLALLVNPLTLGFLFWLSFRPVVAIGPSMRPALAGDPGIGFENLWSYRLHDPHRGDIVSIESAITEPQLLAKRVIGLPGETVAIVAGGVLIDGRPLAEPYVTYGSDEDLEPWLLGPGEYWVMGDNRQDSLDSRAFGPVDREDFHGQIAGMFWPPADADATGVGLLALVVLPTLGLSIACGRASLRTGRRRGLGRRSACWGVCLWLPGCWLVGRRSLKARPEEGFIGPRALRTGAGVTATTVLLGFITGAVFGSTVIGGAWFFPSGLALAAANLALLHLPGSLLTRARRGGVAITIELYWCLGSWLLGQVTEEAALAAWAAVVVAGMPYAAQRIHGAPHLIPAPRGRWSGWLGLLRSAETTVVWTAVVGAFLPVERAGGFALLGAAAAVMAIEAARDRDVGWFPRAAIAVALGALAMGAVATTAGSGLGFGAAGIMLLAFIALDLRRDGMRRLHAEAVRRGGGLGAPA